MSQLILLQTVDITKVYPTKTLVTAPYNCGMILIYIDNEYTLADLICLPSLTIDVYTENNVRISSVSINIETFTSDKKYITHKEPYCIQLYDIPTNCYIYVQPNFDKYGVQSFNNTIDAGIGINTFNTSESGIVNTDTVNYQDEKIESSKLFPITIVFDNSNIKSGGGGGTSGPVYASSVIYDNSSSGMTSTNLQSAVDELKSNQTTITSDFLEVVLTSTNWSGSLYNIENDLIKENSEIFLCTPTNITQEQYTYLAFANIVVREQQNGILTLEALKDVPIINIPLNLLIKNYS